MYGLSKIHKPLVNGFPRLRPILSAINTGTYKWAKFFVTLLKPFTSNNYTVKDSFDFAKDITQQSSKLFMASLDVDSLFTNVPLDETIEICVNELFKSTISDKNCETRTPSPLIQCWLQVFLLISGLGCLAWLLHACYNIVSGGRGDSGQL